jgi:hypothetical protein
MKTNFDVRLLRSALGFLAVAGAGLSLSACATPLNDGSQYLAPDQRPSSLPWNTPASWEGKGQLGAMGTGAQAEGTNVGTGVH